MINVKATTRKAAYPIESLILERWSPRALSGEPLTDKELFTLFEAARWAPSSFNGQPWHFIYAKRDTKAWPILFNFLVDFNQRWTKNAAVLLVIISRNNFDYNNKPERTHSFDVGAAWQNLALQASAMGLIAHGMEGFDYTKARQELSIPDEYTVEAMVAIGRPGNKEDLPEELQKREEPSDRKPSSEWTSEGTFRKKNQKE
jgi:nitroreductase